MKRQKTLTLMAVIVFVLCAIGLFAIAGCKADESEQHEHTFMRVWSSDEEGHWHKASCEHKDVTTPKEPHVDEDGDEECDICGYKIPHKHRYSETFSFNDTEHWREPICGDTLEQSERGAHKYGEAVEIPASCDEDGKLVYTCEVCGKTREEKLDATGHEFGASEVFEQPATCSATGVAAHWECLNCHKPFLKEGDDYVEVDPEELVLQINPDAHEWDAGTITDQPTCTHVGTLTIHCQYDYAHYYTEPIAELPHQWNSQNKCEVCGKERAYSFVDGDSFENSTAVLFGKYPQSKVEDDPTISSLSSKVNTTPSVENGWTNYKYFSVDGTLLTDNDYWYIDVDYEGDTYRGLYFSSLRDTKEYLVDYDVYKTIQDANGYNINIIYWFKYEPIVWRILKSNDGSPADPEGKKAIIMTDTIIDCQPYAYNQEYNRYNLSHIRQFLNSEEYGFYNTAFKDSEREIIIETEVDNSAASTDNPNNLMICENTFDKIFLLSFTEVAKTYDFGCKEGERLWNIEYTQSPFVENLAKRIFKGSEYSYALGLKKYFKIYYGGEYDNKCAATLGYGYSEFWTRSPNSVSVSRANTGNYVGNSSSSHTDMFLGVLPAMWIEIE